MLSVTWERDLHSCLSLFSLVQASRPWIAAQLPLHARKFWARFVARQMLPQLATSGSFGRLSSRAGPRSSGQTKTVEHNSHVAVEQRACRSRCDNETRTSVRSGSFPKATDQKATRTLRSRAIEGYEP